MAAVTTLADLLHALSTAPGPRLTWYGSERVELSGRVLANWVTKTTNLLVEEFDAEPGRRVVLDLPVHWRTLVWALATWRTGATLVLGGEDHAEGADLCVTDRPDRVDAGLDVIAVALPALARSFDGELPPGATDAAAAVMTYGDQLGWVPETDPTADALLDGAEAWTYTQLTAREPDARAGGRVLLDGRVGVRSLLLGGLDVWRAGSSLVVWDPGLAAELDADPARRGRILAQEGVGV